MTDNEALLQSMPDSIREAILKHDPSAFQYALDSLPVEKARQIIHSLRQAGIIGTGPASPTDLAEILAEFKTLFKAIVAVANGDPSQKDEVQRTLPTLEYAGYHLTQAIQSLWAGERDLVALTEKLDSISGQLAACLLIQTSGTSPLNAYDPQALAGSLPPDLLAAVEEQDEVAYLNALEALPEAEQHTAIACIYLLQSFEDELTISWTDPGEPASVEELAIEFEPMLAAIAAVAKGDPTPRPLVEDFLDYAHGQGYVLSEVVHRIWAGERDRQTLLAKLDPQHVPLLDKLLAML